MTLAELLLFAGLIVGVYFALAPIRKRLERILRSWMGASPRHTGQGPVYKIKRED